MQRLFERRGWVAALLIFPALGAWAVSPPRIAENSWTDLVFDALGWILLGCGMLLRLWATLYIGGRKSVSMTTGGPYAMCRHPLYAGSFLVMVALVLLLKSATLALAVGLATAWHILMVIPSEELHLIECFGDAYRDHCRTTPRFVPRLRRFGRPGFTEVKVAAFLQECARGLGFIAVAVCGQIVSHARAEAWWPHLLNWP